MISGLVIVAIIILGTLFSGCLQERSDGYILRDGWFFAVDVSETTPSTMAWYFVAYHTETTPWIVFSEDEIQASSVIPQIVIDYQELPQVVRDFVGNEISQCSTTLVPTFAIQTGGRYPKQEEASWKIILYDNDGNYSGYFGNINYDTDSFFSNKYPQGIYMTHQRERCFCNPINCSSIDTSDPDNPCCWELQFQNDKEEAEQILLDYLNENDIEGVVNFGLQAGFSMTVSKVP